ncbi:MAG: hypothetical protein HGA93_04860 [Methanothrix sp.]|nr:hypothetical protein [Methanothrix sp.]
MNSNPFTELKWPRWEWQINKWSSILSSFLGIAAYFSPFTGESQQKPWIALGIGILSIVIVAPIVIWVVAVFSTITTRVAQYPRLYIHYQDQLRNLQATNKFLGEVVPFFIKFTILRVLFNKEKNRLYVVIQRIEEIKLEEGDGIYVIDEENNLLGEFEISQVRPRDYYALGINVSPTWIGYVRQEGKSEMMPPPDTFATLIPRSS